MMSSESRSKRQASLGLMLLTALALAPPALAVQTPVGLGTAGSYAILAKAGITTTGTTTIGGDIGVSPIAATAITGFGLTMDPSGLFSTSGLVAGNVYAADYAEPTPTNLGLAVLAMQAAYTDAAGRTPPDATGLGDGNISGMTLAPGLYTWATAVTMNDSLILEGGADGVWIFQIGTTLAVGSYAIVHLRGGALPQNVFWQVAGQTTLGTHCRFKGTILDATAIVMQTGAMLEGRALAQTAVTLDAVTMPTAIELLEFSCCGGSEGITLTWHTASEHDNYEWLIERSAVHDGGFQNIAIVPAGAGTPVGRSYRYVDAGVSSNTRYYYRLGDRDLDGRVTWHGPLMATSSGLTYEKLQLLPCHPNPASGTVNIRYILPRSGPVSLNMYDIRGRRVATLQQGHRQGGAYSLAWRCRDTRGKLLPAGVYFYRLTSEGTSLTRRLVLLR